MDLHQATAAQAHTFLRWNRPELGWWQWCGETVTYAEEIQPRLVRRAEHLRHTVADKSMQRASAGEYRPEVTHGRRT